MIPITALLLVGCGPSDTPTDDVDTDVAASPPEIVAWSMLANPLAPLVRTAEATLDVPGTATLLATSGDHEVTVQSDGAATEHRLTLLGLRPELSYDVELVVENAAGSASTTDAFTMDPLPEILPTATVRVSTPARTPGVYLMPLTVDDRSGTWAAVIDGEGSFLWLWDAQGARFHEVQPMEGGIRAISGSNIVEVGWDGEVRQVLDASGITGESSAELHHEVYQEADGRIVSLLEVGGTADDVPTDYDDPTPRGPADIALDEVLTFEPDGSDPQRWPVSALLDSSRIGWDSLKDLGDGRLDWGRANSVDLDPVGDDWIVSVRNQDTVVAVDRATGELEWILANPDGWSPELDALRLQPVGELEWFYHQHAAQMVDDDRLMLFDNGNNRSSPLVGTPGDPLEMYSRVVCYRIDREARTVTQEWTWQPDPSMYSGSQGDVQLLPSGHVLVDFAYVLVEDGIWNSDRDVGATRVHLFEIDPDTGEVAFQLELWKQGAGWENAWYAYRAELLEQWP